MNLSKTPNRTIFFFLCLSPFKTVSGRSFDLGETLNEVTNGEAPHRGPTPSFIHAYTIFDKRVPFHIPCGAGSNLYLRVLQFFQRSAKKVPTNKILPQTFSPQKFTPE